MDFKCAELRLRIASDIFSSGFFKYSRILLLGLYPFNKLRARVPVAVSVCMRNARLASKVVSSGFFNDSTIRGLHCAGLESFSVREPVAVAACK